MQPFSFFAAIFSILLAGAPVRAEVFKVRLSSAPKTLDWNLATTGSEGAVLQNIMRGLYGFSGGQVAGDLARTESWSEDHKKLTITLRANSRWSDGKPLRCQHFLDSYERLLSPTLNSPNASLLFDVEGARDFFLGKRKSFADVGIRCETDQRLEFRLESPRPGFLQVLTHWPTFPYRKDQPTQTLGPYEWSQRSSLQLKKRDRKSSGPDTVQFEAIPDGSRALLDFESGKLQYLLQLEDELLNEGVLKMPGLGFASPVRVVAILQLNPSRSQTNSVDARRAILSRIPVQSLIAAAPNSRLFAPSLIPPGIPGGPTASPSVTVDPPIGTAPSASLTLGFPNDAVSKSIAEVIQEKSKGLKIRIEPLTGTDLRRYDLVISLFGLDYRSADQLLSAFLSQGSLDYFNSSSAELLKRVRQYNPDRPYAAAVDYLQKEAAIAMPLFYRRRAYVLDPRYEPERGAEGTAVLTQLQLKKRPKTR